MMNPFNQTDNERLYNIATGKAASLDTDEALLAENVSKCIKQPQRFEERIVKQKMQTFETEMGGKEMQRSNGKVVAACFVCGLFDSPLCISLEEKV